MIIARAPVRISLGGGGTDLPAYANQFGGYCIAAAIDKYVYVILNPRFDPGSIRVAYANTEIVTDLDEMKHELFRECLRAAGVRGGVELCSMADVPANSGLGSSGSFTVACLAALHAYKGEAVPIERLAQEACNIEIDVLGKQVGKQDQHTAARGGICEMVFSGGVINYARYGATDVKQLDLPHEIQEALNHRLLIFYTGIAREASAVLSKQNAAILSGEALQRMHEIKKAGADARAALMGGSLGLYGEMLHEHWERKRKLTSDMTSTEIDEHYATALSAGATGGKLIGAGGGGFLMFYVRPEYRAEVVRAMEARGLRQLHYRMGAPGVRVIHQD